jgi:hypothetical protein
MYKTDKKIYWMKAADKNRFGRSSIYEVYGYYRVWQQKKIFQKLEQGKVSIANTTKFIMKKLDLNLSQDLIWVKDDDKYYKILEQQDFKNNYYDNHIEITCAEYQAYVKKSLKGKK